MRESFVFIYLFLRWEMPEQSFKLPTKRSRNTGGRIVMGSPRGESNRLEKGQTVFPELEGGS